MKPRANLGMPAYSLGDCRKAGKLRAENRT